MNTIENAKEIISSYKRDDGKKLRIMAVLCALPPLALSTRLVCSPLKKVR